MKKDKKIIIGVIIILILGAFLFSQTKSLSLATESKDDSIPIISKKVFAFSPEELEEFCSTCPGECIQVEDGGGSCCDKEGWKHIINELGKLECIPTIIGCSDDPSKSLDCLRSCDVLGSIYQYNTDRCCPQNYPFQIPGTEKCSNVYVQGANNYFTRLSSCFIGEEKCNGQFFYTCSESSTKYIYSFENKGLIPGKCGYVGQGVGYSYEGAIQDIQNAVDQDLNTYAILKENGQAYITQDIYIPDNTEKITWFSKYNVIDGDKYGSWSGCVGYSLIYYFDYQKNSYVKLNNPNFYLNPKTISIYNFDIPNSGVSNNFIKIKTEMITLALDEYHLGWTCFDEGLNSKYYGGYAEVKLNSGDIVISNNSNPIYIEPIPQPTPTTTNYLVYFLIAIIFGGLVFLYFKNKK